MTSSSIEIADIRAAADRIAKVVRRTPLIESAELNERAGRRVFVKCEPLQITGSFKIRGAFNRLSQLSAEERRYGVVAFSSGNHAQGVARAARLLDTHACIVMPADTPKIKVDNVIADGAEIVWYDRRTESREEIANTIAAKRNAVLVPSFDDPDIIVGQGTVGLEIAEEWPINEPPEATFVPMGGGGLIAGTGIAVHHKWTNTKIIGIEPKDFDDQKRSLASGRIERIKPDARSICDALLTTAPSKLTFAINQEQLSGVETVSDKDVRAAMRFAVRNLKMVVEPGGSVALAAVLNGATDALSAGPICLVLSGGNVDSSVLADILTEET